MKQKTSLHRKQSKLTLLCSCFSRVRLGGRNSLEQGMMKRQDSTKVVGLVQKVLLNQVNACALSLFDPFF